MPLFSKPIARIYVEELRTRLDPLVVPIFTPDTDIDVGDFGSFLDGRYVRRGNVADRGLRPDVDDEPISGFEFASAGKVRFGASAKVPNPLGGELFKAVIGFEKAKAVVASFKGGVERSARDADRFAEQLLELWYGRQLPTDRVVVWSVRRASGGTVVVSEEGNNEVEVLADSALLGPAGITLAGLAVGVTFGAERKATWKLTSDNGPLVSWARLVRLTPDQTRAVDAFGFDRSPDELRSEVAGQAPASFTTDNLLEQL
jgi:hypothetical protein